MFVIFKIEALNTFHTVEEVPTEIISCQHTKFHIPNYRFITILLNLNLTYKYTCTYSSMIIPEILDSYND